MDVGTDRKKERTAARAGGSDAGTLRKRPKPATRRGHHDVPRVLARRDRRDRAVLALGRREVLQRMDRHIDLPAAKRVLECRDERAVR